MASTVRKCNDSKRCPCATCVAWCGNGAAGAIDEREMAWTSLAHRTYAAQANCPVEAAIRKEAADRAVALGRLAMHLNGARECQMDLRLSLLGCMASCDGVHAVIATGVFDVRVAEGAHP